MSNSWEPLGNDLQMMDCSFLSQLTGGEIMTGWWLQPLWNILVNGKDYPIYSGKTKYSKMFQTTNQMIINQLWNLPPQSAASCDCFQKCLRKSGSQCPKLNKRKAHWRLIAFSARKFLFLRKVPNPDLTCFSTDSKTHMVSTCFSEFLAFKSEGFAIFLSLTMTAAPIRGWNLSAKARRNVTGNRSGWRAVEFSIQLESWGTQQSLTKLDQTVEKTWKN